MSVRSRLRTETYSGTRTKYSSGVTNTRTIIGLNEQIDDETGGDNAPLTITRVKRSGGLITGNEQSALTGYSWNGYPCAYLGDSFTTNPYGLSGQPTNGALATELLSRTNPSRSSSEALENLADLKDLGGLAASKFREKYLGFKRDPVFKRFPLLNKLAKVNIMTRFGFVPLLNDMEVLLQFQKLCDSRADELERLRTRGLRRTVDLWSGSNTGTVSSATIQSEGVTLRASVTKTTTRRIRGHVRWYATNGYLKSDEQVRSEAWKTVTGFRLDPVQIYNLFPWSWFADYFFNLGSMVAAANNMSVMTHESVRIMTHTLTHTQSENHTTAGSGIYKVTCTPFTVESETKTRVLASPTLNARTDLLTSDQWSILSSLAVLRS